MDAPLNRRATRLGNAASAETASRLVTQGNASSVACRRKRDTELRKKDTGKCSELHTLHPHCFSKLRESGDIDNWASPRATSEREQQFARQDGEFNEHPGPGSPSTPFGSWFSTALSIAGGTCRGFPDFSFNGNWENRFNRTRRVTTDLRTWSVDHEPPQDVTGLRWRRRDVASSPEHCSFRFSMETERLRENPGSAESVRDKMVGEP